MTTLETAQTSSAPVSNAQTTAVNPAAAVDPLSTAMAELMQAKGIAPQPSIAPPAQPSSEVAKEEVPPAVEQPPAQESPAAASDGKPPAPAPLTQAQLMDRLAAKDGLYQQERNKARTLEQKATDLEKAHNELLARLRADPMAVLREQNIRFGDLAMQALAHDGKALAQPKQPGEQPAAQSPELAALKAQIDEQAAFIKQVRERDTQAEAQRADEASIAVLKEHIPATDFPLVAELGKFTEVRRRVQQHMGPHGQFADDREALEVLHYYAREVEGEERQRLLGHVNKPGIRSLLSKELGLPAGGSTQREAPPARQDNEGNRAAPNTRPAVSNDLTTQRSVVSPPQSWDPEEAMRRTIAEVNQLRGS